VLVEPPEVAVPVADAVETGSVFGAGCSVTFGGESLDGSGKYDFAGASAWGAYARIGAVAGGEAAGGLMAWGGLDPIGV